MESSDAESESQFGLIRRISSIVAVAAISFLVVVSYGFGAKTGCTNSASLHQVSEAPCDAIDSFAWAGLIGASSLAVIGYGGLVPSRISELWIGLGIFAVLIVACLSMSQVTAM